MPKNLTYPSWIVISISLIAILIPIGQTGKATVVSPYKSGYNHGCADTKISLLDDRYINQPGKGPSFHSKEFMNGYNDGYLACSGGKSAYDQGYDRGFNNAKHNIGFSQKVLDSHSEAYGNGYAKGWNDGCNKFMDLPPNTAEGCNLSMDTGE